MEAIKKMSEKQTDSQNEKAKIVDKYTSLLNEFLWDFLNKHEGVTIEQINSTLHIEQNLISLGISTEPQPQRQETADEIPSDFVGSVKDLPKFNGIPQ